MQPYPSGIQSQTIARYTIGYILRGSKRIFSGDSYREAKAGSLFFLDIGTHYIENAPDGNEQFEQISCYYSQSQIANIIATLSTSMEMEINAIVEHADDDKDFVICPAWSTIKSFFINVNQYIRCNSFSVDNVAEQIKTTELVYLILSNNECSIRNRLLSGIDFETENFEHCVRRHVFDNMSIEEMSKILNKSMTSFKKEFRTVFGQQPHR
ncbi:MAG: AraC family transcriptional regulator [Tidjanibacter sp.]|nr:AraC family transcriptional regulator [Tidjanibacter sp.]